MKYTVRFLILVAAVLLITFSSTVYAGGTPFQYNLGPETKNLYENVLPGDVIEGSAVVSFSEDVVARVDFEVDSKSQYLNSLGYDLMSWLEMKDGYVYEFDATAEGVDTLVVPFVFNIPSDIPPGDYSFILSARVVKVDTGEVVSTKAAGVAVATAIGQRIKLSVAGERTHKLDLLSLKVKELVNKVDDVSNPEVHGNSSILLDVEMQNIGNTLLKPTMVAVVRDMMGNIVFEETFDKKKPFFPSINTIPLAIQPLSPFFSFVDVEVKLSYAVMDITGEVVEDGFEAATGTLRVYNIPWTEISIGFGVLFLILFILLFRRFRLSRLRASSQVYVVLPGDTLQIVCSRFGADPSDVIAANSMKEPYFLEIGAQILIPMKGQ